MRILALNATTIGILALLLGVIILGGAIYFFQVSRRSLQKVLHPDEETRPQYGFEEYTRPGPVTQVSTQPVSPSIKTREHFETPPSQPVKQEKTVRPEKPSEENIHTLREVIARQQQLLTSLLERAEEAENNKLAQENESLEQKIADLELALDEKDQDIQSLNQQLAASQKMTDRIEEVYREFESLQTRLKDLEAQAGKANQLEMEMVDLQESYEQLKKDVVRKQTKLEDTFAENQRLQLQLNEVEDKLAEANLQRQQLQKKVQFLQDLNNDFQHMADSNKRLQTELRRIGELESMLNMIAEERDILLRKQRK